MGNINGEKFKMNYIIVNHLVRLYDDVKHFGITDEEPLLTQGLLLPIPLDDDDDDDHRWRSRRVVR